ncbi:hypothetical protein [Micromonospora coerulea]|uniref:hypothetical protein n=1 Tax=Micromonospora coerulea TaxID=47856 RepID=UPI001907D2C5|nr:hypothetical protein [Micromonospora veneta]
MNKAPLLVGRHVQVGLLPAAQVRPALPMELVIAFELERRGSHGMSAHAYLELLRLVTTGVLRPAELITLTPASTRYPPRRP